MNTGLASTLYVAFWFALIGGYIANIVKFVTMIGGEANALFLGRIVGIFFAPLGVILGYM